MRNGKTILVFSPINKGWGSSTTAIALSAMLEQAVSGKILLIDFFIGVSAIEHYLKKDMCKNPESMPLEIFVDSIDSEKLMLFCRQVSKDLYFLKLDGEKLQNEQIRRLGIFQLIAEAKELFDIIIVRTDSRLTREVNFNWDAGISVSSYENGFDMVLERAGSFNWYRELIRKENCIKVVNGVPYDWGVRESVKEYITGKERAYLVPYNGELIVDGNIGSRLYSRLREELLASRSLYSKKIGKVANRIMEVANLKE